MTPKEYPLSLEASDPNAGSNIVLRDPSEEIIRIDKEGFHYRGQFIADAGEAHRLMLEFLKQHTA